MSTHSTQNHELYGIKRMTPLFLQSVHDTPSLENRLFSSVKDASALASIAVHNCYRLRMDCFKNVARVPDSRTLLMKSHLYQKDPRCAKIIAIMQEQVAKCESTQELTDPPVMHMKRLKSAEQAQANRIGEETRRRNRRSRSRRNTSTRRRQ